MPSGRGVDEVKGFSLALPRFERLDVDLDRQARQVAARMLGELRAHLDADDGEAALEQCARCLARRAPDLQEPIAGFELGQLDEIVEQLVRVRRPRCLIQVSGRIEGAPQRLACLAHVSNRSEKCQDLDALS
jgi:hypothetical protein